MSYRFFRFRKKLGKHWFGKRMVDERNKQFPNDVINAKTVESFKRRLDKYMTEKGWV